MKITRYHVESVDNAKFLGAIERSSHAIYLEDPANMKQPLMRQGNCPAVMLHCRVNSVCGIVRKSEKMSSSFSVKVLFVSGP